MQGIEIKPVPNCSDEQQVANLLDHSYKSMQGNWEDLSQFLQQINTMMRPRVADYHGRYDQLATMSIGGLVCAAAQMAGKTMMPPTGQTEQEFFASYGEYLKRYFYAVAMDHYAQQQRKGGDK